MAETRVVITAEAEQAIREFGRLRAQASQSLNEVGQGSSQFDRVTTSARQTAAAMRQVPAQFTDIVVSLQAGQNPLTVLLQQGGQLRDMFGSTGAAASALGKYAMSLVTPYTLLGGAAAVLALAYYQGSKEADAYTRAIAMSGNAAGVSKDQLADMARSIRKAGETQGAGAEALAALVETGKVGRENLQAFATTAIRAQKTIGNAVSDTAKDFKELGQSPVEATMRLNERYNYLTESVYLQIRALEKKGDIDGAAEIAQKAYATAMDERSAAIRQNLGSLERAWGAVRGAAARAWDSMLDIGRDDTLEQQIEAVKKKINKINLEQMSFVGSSRENKAESNVRKAALQAELDGLEKKQKADRDANEEKAKAVALDQARIKWSQDGEKYLTRQKQLELAIDKARAEGAAAKKSDQEIEERVAQVVKSYSDIANDSINAQIEGIKRRGNVEDIVTRRSMDLLASKHSVGLVNERDYIEQVTKLDLAAFDKAKSRIQEELALTAKKQNTEKDQAALRGQLDELSAQQLSRKIQGQNQLDELEVRSARQAAENTANVIDKQADAARQLADQVTAQRDANDQIGLTKQGLAALTATRLRERAALAEQNADIAEGVDFSGQLAEKYRQQAQSLRDLAAAQEVGAAKSAIADKFSAKDLEDFLDPAKAKSFGDALKDAFGGAGDAMVKLRTTLEDYGAAQTTIERARGAAAVAFANDSTKLAAANVVFAKKEVQARVSAYADMAGAAKGFFSENSKGFKVLEATEKAFRVYELAMAAESMAKKIFFKEGEVAANAALNATKTAGEATASAASTGLAATEASAWGITAVVKAIASLPFPMNLVAGAATLAAVVAIGAKITGGVSGSKSITEQRQETQGTGTVFGNSTAKSDSIARSIEQVADNSDIELNYTRGMLTSLRSIESSISGLGNLLVRTSGLTNSTFTDQESSAKSLFMSMQPFWSIGAGTVGKWVSSVFGGKKTVEDTGFTIDPTTLASAMAGNVNSYQYAQIKKDGGWFHSDKTSIEKSELGDSANAQFARVINSLGASVSEAAKLLGLGGDEFTAKLNSFVIDIGKISLKGLSGDEIQEQLEAVFSKLGDDMAQFGVAGLEPFQKVGEGYFETLTRVASNYANLDAIQQSLGTTFGATGVASLAARESLIDLAGGIDKLASQSSSFADNFMTEAERLAPVQKYVTEQLAAMGLQGLDTRDKFKEYVLGLANSGALLNVDGSIAERSQQQYLALMALSDAFAKTHAATEDLTRTEQEIADERKDLQQQYDELTMTTVQLAEKARSAIASQNLALYDQIQAEKALVAAKDAVTKAQSDLLSAYQKQRSALQSVVTAQSAAVEATKKQIDALKLGALSNLSPEQKYLEAQRQFDAAAEGDAKIAAGQALLQASQAFNGSSAQYSKDYAKVQAALAIQAASQQAAVSMAQQQLAALDAQVGSLIDINTGVDTLNSTALAVQQGIAALGAALSAQAVAAAAVGRPDNAAATQGRAAMTGVIENLYSSLLGRHSDTAGMDYWLSMLESGKVDYDHMASFFTASDEYKARNITAHAKGGLADGWSLVGEEGPEVVNFADPGRVYTAAQTREALSGSSSTVEAERQTRAMEHQNKLLDEQNRLLDEQNKLLARIEAGAASGADIRNLKQSMIVALSKKNAVPA